MTKKEIESGIQALTEAKLWNMGQEEMQEQHDELIKLINEAGEE